MELCENCINRDCAKDRDTTCAALLALRDVYRRMRMETRAATLVRLREQVEATDCEEADDLRTLGESIISAVPEMGYIAAYDIRVGYVRSWERKLERGRYILGDCRKVSKTYGAYLPYDFVITIYAPNVAGLTENQLKIVMLHELKHIGIGPRGPKLEEHEVEDFRSILQKYGLDWDATGAEVPDILSG